MTLTRTTRVAKTYFTKNGLRFVYLYASRTLVANYFHCLYACDEEKLRPEY